MTELQSTEGRGDEERIGEFTRREIHGVRMNPFFEERLWYYDDRHVRRGGCGGYVGRQVGNTADKHLKRRRGAARPLGKASKPFAKQPRPELGVYWSPLPSHPSRPTRKSANRSGSLR
jgi:hypothetical protein